MKRLVDWDAATEAVQQAVDDQRRDAKKAVEDMKRLYGFTIYLAVASTISALVSAFVWHIPSLTVVGAFWALVGAYGTWAVKTRGIPGVEAKLIDVWAERGE
jgi:hypothetical protein